MDDTAFWKLIDRVRNEYPDDLDDQCTYLAQVLQRLPPAECLSAGRWFDRCVQRAYHWPLWGAAFVIGGGCSDDSFMDFRASLIMRGGAVFEAALHDPDSLADLTSSEDAWFYEGFQYVFHEAMDDAADRTTADGADDEDAEDEDPDDPREPTGTEWREDELANLLPRLYAKHAS